MDLKKITAPTNTTTRDVTQLSRETNNIYETAMIIAKRANQISAELKQELSRKLEEFSGCADSLEEVFENREQIEISKHYERMPKPTLIAIEEFLNNKIYYRKAESNQAATATTK